MEPRARSFSAVGLRYARNYGSRSLHTQWKCYPHQSHTNETESSKMKSHHNQILNYYLPDSATKNPPKLASSTDCNELLHTYGSKAQYSMKDAMKHYFRVFSLFLILKYCMGTRFRNSKSKWLLKAVDTISSAGFSCIRYLSENITSFSPYEALLLL